MYPLSRISYRDSGGVLFSGFVNLPWEGVVTFVDDVGGDGAHGHAGEDYDAGKEVEVEMLEEEGGENQEDAGKSEDAGNLLVVESQLQEVMVDVIHVG